MNFKKWQTIDWSLFILPIVILTLGIATIYTVSYLNRGSALAVGQATSALFGVLLMILLTFIDYRLFKGLIIPIYIVGLLLLGILAVEPLKHTSLVVSSFGAARWINLGFTQLQPSELFKAILIIVLAGYLSDKRDRITWKNVVVVLMVTIVPVLLTLKQPDLGTAMVLMSITVTMLVVASLPRIYYYIFGVGSLILMPLSWFVLRDYQKQRLLIFFNPKSDSLGAGYNVLQSLIAVGSGGATGRGFGQGSQSQLNFLPVAHTDFIFAGFAEATGFVGAFILIVLLFVLVTRALAIAKLSKDDFGTFLAAGIGSMILFQMFVNIGMNISIMPVTGIPLPFMSYGGTSLMVGFLLLGILQSIYVRHKKITFN